MMRLQRVGRKNDPSYRIVVTDKRTGPKSNKHVDLIGSVSPKLGTATIDTQKVHQWLAKGVQPSTTVYNLLITKKIIEGKKRNALSRKSPIVDEEAVKKAAEEKAAQEATQAEAVTADTDEKSLEEAASTEDTAVQNEEVTA